MLYGENSKQMYHVIKHYLTRRRKQGRWNTVSDTGGGRHVLGAPNCSVQYKYAVRSTYIVLNKIERHFFNKL